MRRQNKDKKGIATLWFCSEWRSKDRQWLGDVGHRQDRQGRGTGKNGTGKAGPRGTMSRNGKAKLNTD